MVIFRRIAGAIVGAVIFIVVALLAGGVATALFHLKDVEHTDVEHPTTILPLAGIAVFGVGAFIGGLAGAYCGVRISRWFLLPFLIALGGAFDAYLSAEMFANSIAVWSPSILAVVLGCWLGTRQVGGTLE